MIERDSARAAFQLFLPLIPPSQTGREVFDRVKGQDAAADMRAIPNQWLLDERGLSSRLGNDLVVARAEAESLRGLLREARTLTTDGTGLAGRIDAALAAREGK